jgi:hypothetical protein
MDQASNYTEEIPGKLDWKTGFIQRAGSITMFFCFFIHEIGWKIQGIGWNIQEIGWDLREMRQLKDATG